MATYGFIGSVPNVILTFPKEREVFLTEYSNNMYTVSAYYLAKTIAELPFQIFPPLAYGLMVYWTIGCN